MSKSSMQRSRCVSLCLALLLGASFTATNAFGQSAARSQQVMLDKLAELNMDQGAVQVYLTGYGGGYDMRLCVYAAGADGNGLKVYRCKFDEPQQKWLLNRDRQVVAQANPGLCWTWGDNNGSTMTLSQCQTRTVDANQKFHFQANGTIASVDGSKCLNVYNSNSGDGTDLITWGCNEDPNEKWTLQPDPLKLVSMAHDSTNYLLYAVQSASTGYSAGLNFVSFPPPNPSLNSYWFFTGANDATDRYFIQNAQTGYCLTASGGEQIVADGCKAPGHDAHQKWALKRTGSSGDKLYYEVFNADKGVYLSSKLNLSNWPYPVAGASPPNGQITFGGAAAVLNVVLTNTNEQKNTACLAVVPGTDQLQKRDCETSLQDFYLAAFDILPNNTIRSRVTSKCLDNYGGSLPGVIAQYGCDPATSNARANQQWTPLGNTYQDLSQPIAWTFGKSFYIASGKENLHVLLQNANNGQLAIQSINDRYPGDSGFADSQWYLAPFYQLAHCAAPTHRRVPRSVEDDTRAAYSILLNARTIADGLFMGGADGAVVADIMVDYYVINKNASNRYAANIESMTLDAALARLIRLLEQEGGQLNETALGNPEIALGIFTTINNAGVRLDNHRANITYYPYNPVFLAGALGDLSGLRTGLLQILAPHVPVLPATPMDCAAQQRRFDSW